MGVPAEGYPWHWSVYRWLEGETAIPKRIADPRQTASELGRFVAALQGIEPADGPRSGAQNNFRGVPLAERNCPTRAAIAALEGVFDPVVLTEAWEEALRNPVWSGLPVWLHGDIHSGNLLVVEGRLSAVIDFGLMGVGDPTCEMMVAWWLLSAETRGLFRREVSIDEATWKRGRGWALYGGLVALAYYLDPNEVLAGMARHAIDEVLADIA